MLSAEQKKLKKEKLNLETKEEINSELIKVTNNYMSAVNQLNALIDDNNKYKNDHKLYIEENLKLMEENEELNSKIKLKDTEIEDYKSLINKLKENVDNKELLLSE